jgi:hypothetical protein
MPFLAPVVGWLLLSTVGNLVLAVATSMALKAVTGLFGKSGSQAQLDHDAANHQVTVRQPAAPRRVVYGKDLIGGIYTFTALSGATNEFLEIVVTYTGHEIDAYEEFWLGDDLVTIDGSGNAIGKYAGYLKIETKLGAAGEAAFPNLVASLPTKWTSNHRQDGCASVHYQFKTNTELYPQGLPNPKVKLRGKKVFDPRTSTTAWSDNAALCMRDYITDASIGLGSSDVDDTIASAAATISDEAVAIHGSTTEPRYRTWGTFDLSERPGDVMKALCVAMSGRVNKVAGKWRIYAGAWRAPELLYFEDDFRSGIQYNVRRSRRDTCNGVKGTFIDPENKWQPTDFPPYYRSAARGYAQDDYLLEDGGIRIWRDVEFRFVKWASTCQRLAKLELESTRRQGGGVFPFKLSGYLAAPPDVIAVRHARFGWTDKSFEVTDFDTSISDGDDGVPKIGTTATVVETDADVYAWTAADDVAQNVAASIPLPVAQNGADAASLTATNSGGGVVTLHWPPATDDSVYSDGTWQIQYKLHSAGTWTSYGYVTGDSISVILSLTAAAYDFQIRSRSGDNIPSGWTQLLNWTVT